ncbi:VacB/RNase II family 3'-5' exoribonuclease [Bermanella marisrubri]|nr:VacB/RNase II family 3'-5' exoribonuclease [Bermanella marisrubri]QIZ84821.1 VacB/RNase II family 3'-5' exoribonuclease [Bermanella marisrubri]
MRPRLHRGKVLLSLLFFIDHSPMLNSDSLAQLKSLKTQIKTDQEANLQEGTVRGSAGRFGFVSNEQGESFFLPPDEMAKVFPGDEIRFSTKEDDKGKTQAIVEKLIKSYFKSFCGYFVKRGKAQFVVPDIHQLNNWIYIPPEACKDVNENDWLQCEVTRHPYPKGKPQAKILKNLGQLSEPGFERQYAITKFNLSHEWPDIISSELAILGEDRIPALSEGRVDLSDHAFVTIDSEHTRDMDDALYAEKTEDGYRLHVAIADPSAWFGPNTSLDREARSRGNSLYFPGRSLAMLPQELSNGLCSLLEGEKRLALVCVLSIGTDGELNHYEFKEATVTSHAKLSYNQVTEFLEGEKDAVKAELQDSLLILHETTQALHQGRIRNNLIMEDRDDYYLTVGDNGKLQSIVRTERNTAQKLVEEAMLAANKSCAQFLKEIGIGIFVDHPGFRTERIGDIKQIVQDKEIGFEGNFAELEGYKSLIRAVDAKEFDEPIKTLLSRFLSRSEYSLEAKPHMGMGFECYTTFTSPIRKYSDLLIHRIIKAHLSEQKQLEINDETIALLQDALVTGRRAVNLAEHWLKLQYLDKLKENQFDGVISQINPGGLTVTITELGLDGFIDLRKNKALSFNRTYLMFEGEKQTFTLDQKVKVEVKKADLVDRKLELAIV